MIIGIVGAEEAKFTDQGRFAARVYIASIIDRPEVKGVSSGHCHLGGVDIWAEEIAKMFHKHLYIYPPTNRSWSTGYRPRNIQIADISDELYCITVDALPPDFAGMRFDYCYHCGTKGHIKSGGCWTVKYAMRQGKPGFWHVVHQP